MKKIIVLYTSLVLITVDACKKEKRSEKEPETPVTPVATDHYTSLNEFYLQNGAPKQTFTINAATGGSFISAKGTTVNVPANTFSNTSGIVNIEFRDIYKKSDMLLSNMTTNTFDGTVLASAGEFFIKASTQTMHLLQLPMAKK